MIGEIKFLPDEGENEPVERGALGDEIIRKIDNVMNGASWEASENGGWLASK